ncbi:hypothetical protein Clacol_001989 [Clathrus columnatus]|uniref:Transmembrane protein n=1 Tax=Clathrus columnatus TaxID=1419009 RepID=A0AAV4ZZJ7_9AGAM|nr:hypothetical protein Clacol_001989 [Clathrus columnatus]
MLRLELGIFKVDIIIAIQSGKRFAVKRNYVQVIQFENTHISLLSNSVSGSVKGGIKGSPVVVSPQIATLSLTIMIFLVIIPLFASIPFIFFSLLTEIPIQYGLPSAIPRLCLPPGPIVMVPTLLPALNTVISNVSDLVLVSSQDNEQDVLSVSTFSAEQDPKNTSWLSVFDFRPLASLIPGNWIKLSFMFVVVPVIAFALGYLSTLAWDCIVTRNEERNDPVSFESTSTPPHSPIHLPTIQFSPVQFSLPLHELASPTPPNASILKSPTPPTTPPVLQIPHTPPRLQRRPFNDRSHNMGLGLGIIDSSIPRISYQTPGSPLRTNRVKSPTVSSPVLLPTKVEAELPQDQNLIERGPFYWDKKGMGRSQMYRMAMFNEQKDPLEDWSPSPPKASLPLDMRVILGLRTLQEQRDLLESVLSRFDPPPGFFSPPE